jgi:hypothetical protein
VIQVLDERRHGLQDGDIVKFEEISGMTELNYTTNIDNNDNNNNSNSNNINSNKSNEYPIKVVNCHSFEIETSEHCQSDYSGGGLFFQIKQSKTIPNFATLDELFADEPLLISKLIQTDSSKSSLEQHLFWIALQEFRAKSNQIGRAHV